MAAIALEPDSKLTREEESFEEESSEEEEDASVCVGRRRRWRCSFCVPDMTRDGERGSVELPMASLM